jgi:hypothetical protein
LRWRAPSPLPDERTWQRIKLAGEPGEPSITFMNGNARGADHKARQSFIGEREHGSANATWCRETSDGQPIHARAFAELEAEGLITKSGRFRRSPKTGEMQPVYIVTEKGKREFEERMARELADDCRLDSAGKNRCAPVVPLAPGRQTKSL